MTRFFHLIIQIIVVFTISGFIKVQGIMGNQNQTNREMLDLTKNWEFSQAGKDKWYAASVPGVIHTDLMSHKLIDDPFYRDNEKKLQWIGKTDWVYRTEFSVSEEIFSYQNIEIVFKGLDTYASVLLNDRELLATDNMFREWRKDCKTFLKPGSNSLLIKFRSPINEVLPIMEKMEYVLPAVNDLGEKTSPYTRKAPYQYGWDWGPRFVTMGIWQPVYLDCWNELKISDFQIFQHHVSSSNAYLTATFQIQSELAQKALLRVLESNDKFESIEQEIMLIPGKHDYSVQLHIVNPELWWPAGLGEQPLYTIVGHIMIDGRGMDQKNHRIGIRSARLNRVVDEWGKSFEFVINDVPVFARGGNWIPADNFPNRVSREKYYNLIKSCRDANMNMLRVWGGGIYESRDFYEICDELGIMVWQDFMFACSMYPADDAFLENVRYEATDQIKRLRNHPSIVLWCGNNEIESAWCYWGWQERIPQSTWDDYLKLFHKLLPEVCASVDPGRPYWPSSPSSNLDNFPHVAHNGDIHYWGVWHGKDEFKKFEDQHPRFMSEYGFQSFPEFKTIQSFAIEGDYDIESDVMTTHQKSGKGNRLIREYMLREYPEPKDFRSFLYVSQVLQAEGMKIGVEHLRRIMPQCMGSLYWQINDCWPVASWSSIDYFGRWKALHYFAKRFYEPLLVSPKGSEDNVQTYIVSDSLDEVQAKLHVKLLNFNGSVLKEETIDVNIKPLRSIVYHNIDIDEWLLDKARTTTFLSYELVNDEKVLSTNNYYFKPFKEMRLSHPHITYEVAKNEDKYILTLTSDKLARNVYIESREYDGFFTDNYFDLLPGQQKIVEFQFSDDVNVKQLEEDFQIISIIDAF